ARCLRRRQLGKGRQGGGGASIDRQGWLINPAQFLGRGIDVHQLLPWTRDVEQAVAAGRHLAQTRTDHQQEIAVLDPLKELWINANSDVAHIIGVAIVEAVLAAKDRCDRKIPGLDEALQVGTYLRAVAGTDQE